MQSARQGRTQYLPVDNVNGYCRPLSPALLFCQACCAACRLQVHSLLGVGIGWQQVEFRSKPRLIRGTDQFYRLAAAKPPYR